MFDRVDIVESLLVRGADPARKDGGGLSSADLARSMGAKTALALIERCGSAGEISRRGPT